MPSHPTPAPALGASSEARRGTRRRAVVAAALFAVTAAAFARVASHAFLAWDDGGYVASNARVQAGLTAENVRWAFTTFQQTNWHPLTWLSYMLDCTLYGVDPRPHHLTNVWLHGLNGVLLFLVLDAMTGAPGRSAVVAALFALHPLHVESVAWVAERKDVLSTFFGLLALAAYVRWTRRPSAAGYLAVCVAYALSLMAKPMLVTLPFLLLVLDAWPLRRWRRAVVPRRLVIEKLPLFVLAVASSAVTVAAQGAAGAIRALHDVTLADRVANAVASYVGYLARTFWPAHLACFYPYPRGFSPDRVGAAAVLLAAVSVGAVALRRRSPALLVGWLWYLGTLVPVIGLVQVGSQAMADRYTYVPLIGVFVALVWGVGDALAPREAAAGCPVPGRVWLGRLLAALVLVTCFVLTRRQVEHWRDGVALFEHALAIHGDDETIHYLLAVEALRLGRLDAATVHYDAAVRVAAASPGERSGITAVLERQGWPPPRAAEQAASLTEGLGLALWKRGRVEEAARFFAETVRLRPASAEARNNLALAHAAAGRAGEALADLAEALRLRPDFADARFNRGNVLASAGRLDEAIADYRAALALNPNLHEARNNLGVALERAGRPDAAGREYREAIRRAQDYVDPVLNLADLHARAGELDAAEAEYRAALRRAPDHPQAHFGLGNVLAAGGRFAEAVVAYQAALAARPSFPEARANLERARRAAEGAAPG